MPLTAEIEDRALSHLTQSIKLEARPITGQKDIEPTHSNESNVNLFYCDYTRTNVDFDYVDSFNLTLPFLRLNQVSKNISNKFRSAFQNEVKTKSDYLPLEFSEAKKIFDRIGVSLSDLPFINFAFELTYKSGLKFTLLFPDNKLLLISKPLNNEISSSDGDTIIYSLFINRELIVSNTDELENFKEGFKKYLAL